MTGRGRLARLREVLLTVPEERFDLDTWANNCGTTACAVGWAALDPVLRSEGLNLNVSAFIGGQHVETPLAELKVGVRVVGMVLPRYAGHDGWGAVERFFGLSSCEAEDLFAADSYPSYSRGSSDVADRIGEFLASVPFST